MKYLLLGVMTLYVMLPPIVAQILVPETYACMTCGLPVFLCTKDAPGLPQPPLWFMLILMSAILVTCTVAAYHEETKDKK